MKLKINHDRYFINLLRLSQPTVLLVIISCNFPITSQSKKSVTNVEEYREIRREKLNQSRPVIHNNDGNDAYSYPAELEFSISNFLGLRTSGLSGTDVSTISYNTICSSFGQFTHATKVGEFLTLDRNNTGTKNIVPELIKTGMDPLEVTIHYAHENGFEFFWSNRINDTHDYIHRIDKPYERWSTLKAKHPEYLFGTVGEKLPHGRWSAVDFSYTEIRDLCIQYYTEVCENYDVDGIELDFFRHLYLFRNVARGGVATAEQRDMLTDMLTKIRKMTEKVGMKKGKPILVLIRIPDSIEYCRGVGIDLINWMENGLVDIVVGSDYFRLNPWDYLVEQGHKFGVKVYAGLSEPRIKKEHPLLIRQQNSVYRARSSAAWESGVDGLYIFNEVNTRSQYLSEIGSQGKLKDKNNLYFVTYLNGDPNIYLKVGRNNLNLPLLTPFNPVSLGSMPVELLLEIGDESKPAKVALILYTKEGSPEAIKVNFNGVSLKYQKGTDYGLSVFEIPPLSVKPGKNNLKLLCENKQKALILLDAAVLFYRDSGEQDTKQMAALCFDH